MELLDLITKIVKKAITKKTEEEAFKLVEKLRNAGADPDGINEGIRTQDASAHETLTGEAAGGEKGSMYSKPVLIRKRTEQFPLAQNVEPSTITDRGSAAYFGDLINRNLHGVEVRYDVQLSELSSIDPPVKVPLDVVIYRDGQPSVAIIIVSKNHYRRAGIIFTMNACENSGIPALRFFREFENEPEYVIGRINTVL